MNSPNPTAPLMQMAQQTLSNPVASAVPAPQGGIDAGVHPIVAGLVKLLANAASSYGWTSMPPQQRLEAQGQEQQKAETMARLAQTGAYQQGELEYRKNMADVAGQRAGAYEEDVQSKKESRDTQNAIKQQALDLAKEKNNWQKDMAQGRLDQAKTRISNQAQQFEKSFQIRVKQVGLEQAKVEMMEQGLGIKQGFLDLAKSALSQKGTTEGVNTITKLQGLAMEHPILSSIFGLDDVTSMVGESRGAGIPGVGAGGQPPTVGATPATAPPANPKAAAKNRQKNPPAAVQQFHYDAQGNRVAGPQ
jgi:hypothetical protein